MDQVVYEQWWRLDCINGTEIVKYRCFTSTYSQRRDLPGVIFEYTILKPSFVVPRSVTNDTKTVLPLLKTSLGRDVPLNVCRSGAVASFPS